MCPNYEPEGQGRGSTFRVCHALKKIAILLNKSLIPSHLKWPALYVQFPKMNIIPLVNTLPTVPENECEAFAVL